VKRAITGAVLAGLLAALLAAAGIAAAVAWEPPDQSRCAVLLEQAEHTSDVAAELEEAGCIKPAVSTGQDLTARP
jgi:hypothetical protein